MSVQLRSGSTYLSKKVDFKIHGVNNTVVTLNATPTISQLEDMVLECEVGAYGGAINGATCYVEYSVAEDYPSYYTYTFTVDEDVIIDVLINAPITDAISFKRNGEWVKAIEVYKRINGSWVKYDELTSVFDHNVNYVKGELNG